MAETLKFGPEWMRNLSSDTHCRPQSPSAPTSRFKLAEHRYSKEDMLALFSPDLEAPPELKLTSKIFIEKALEPLGFTAPSETEQKLLSQMSSSNAASTTRPAPPTTMRTTLSLSQLRSSESARKTRGSGRLDPMYYKSSADDEDYVRTRHFNRDQWDDSMPASRGRGLGFTGRSFDDPSDVSRSMAAESWRGPKKKWNDDDTGNWRKQFPSQKPSNRSWREPWENNRIRGSDDLFKDKVFRRSFSSSHAQNNHHHDDELEQLPEWSTDDFGDVGTFDATGAFMSVKELEIIEEQRQQKEVDDYCSRSNDGEEHSSKECLESRDLLTGVDVIELRGGQKHETSLVESNGQLKEDINKHETVEPECPRESGIPFEDSQCVGLALHNGSVPEANSSSLYAGMSIDVVNLVDSLMASNEDDDALGVAHNEDINFLQLSSQKQYTDNSSNALDGTLFPKHPDLQQKFLLEEHLQQQPFPQQFQQQSQQILNHQQLQQYQQHPQQQSQQQPYIKGFVLPNHEDAYKWFYRDPQGDIQGPFTQLQMSEWFSVGYFNMNLLVKQGCDNNFLPIGTLVKLIGSNPFQIAYQTSAAMSHLKNQASNNSDQSLELQSQTQQLSQHLQQLQLKQQQQIDHFKIMQLLQLNPRSELLQLVQNFQHQQLHQSNSSRPILEAISAQSAASGGDNGVLSLHQQYILQKQQQHLSQILQQQQLGPFPHRSFSQSSNESQPPFIGGAIASNSTSYLLQANQTSVPHQVASSAWKAANDISSYSSKTWDKSLMGLELSRPITAQALEQLQYLALEKQQRIDSAALITGGISINGEQSNQMEGLSIGGVREQQQLRVLLQQEAARLSALNDERQRMIGSAEMLERQKLEELRRRQEKAEAARKMQLIQEQQLETFKKLKQQQPPQGKHNALLGGATLNLNSMQRQVQPLQGGSSPNFQSSNSSTAAISHPLESVLSFQQHQTLLQKQQVNKSWSLTNQSWVNGANGGNGGHVGALDASAGAWGNSSYSQQQFLAPPSHSATTSFTNTTSDPNHLLEEPFQRARAGLYNSTLSSASANNIWLDGSNENHGLTSIASQQQALGSNSSNNSYDKSLKESLIMWCESELKDQVPNGNIPSIIQQLLDSNALSETLNIVKAFFVNADKATSFAVGFIDRRNQLMSRKNEHLTAVMRS